MSLLDMALMNLVIGFGILKFVIIFKEKVLYKDLLQQHEKKENDYVVLDDTPKYDILVVPPTPQNLQQKNPYTLVNLR